MTINVKDILLGAAIGGAVCIQPQPASTQSLETYLSIYVSLPSMIDTRTVGVFIITLHHGKNLAAQDANGKSDPCLSFFPPY